MHQEEVNRQGIEFPLQPKSKKYSFYCYLLSKQCLLALLKKKLGFICYL